MNEPLVKLNLLCYRSLGLNTVSAYQRAKVSALKIVNLRMRRSNNNAPRENDPGEQHEASSVPPIIRKQKGKYSRTPPPPNLSNGLEQARLSMEPIEPIRPSNIITNTHKTRI